MSNPFQVSLAPQQLWQAINPWTFNQDGAQIGLVNIDLGQTPNPQAERAILNEVGSYGRQIGRIGDALEVILNHVVLDNLSPTEKDAIDILRGQLAQVREVKARVENEKN
jgi:heterodisulfide reductase subunit C